MKLLHYGPDAIRAAVGFEDVLEPVSAALSHFSAGLGDSPVSVFAPAGVNGDVHVKSAWLPGRAIFTVKVATWFAERARRGGAAGSGIIAAFDAATGDLHALLEDEHHLSDIRTAAAGALAARTLARPDATVMGVLGTGTQAYLQVLAAAAERPITEVRVWGRRPDRASNLVAALRARRPDLRVIVVPDPRSASSGVDLLVTATASTQPLVRAQWLTPGLHITAVGADDTAKLELTAECLRRADRIVVDSRALAAIYGDLARAGMGHDDLVELGELLSGAPTERRDDKEITICKLVGLGVQDLAAAEVTLARLREDLRAAARPASALDLQRDA